jgi:aryl-alcohol dehydrogenase-like predicted oxidoreductase
MFPRFQAENFDHNLQIVRRLESIAARKGCPVAQLALAWVLAQGDVGDGDIVPIFGAKKQKYVEENVGAVNVRLDARDLDELDAAVPRDAAAGQRYPAASMASVQK